MKTYCVTPAEAAASIRLAHLEGGYFSITSVTGQRTVWYAESGPGRKTAFLVEPASGSSAALRSYDLEDEVIWEQADYPSLAFPRYVHFVYDYQLTHDARQALYAD